ncbi:MAG: XdhC family protein [Gammaproteobacteria bacterium]|nr:XdhC family protein [Gammaproteobacteria bacterium]MCY4218627.1 XdhC family protein [Gammaproteobacteria bacterium]MCY4275364.1 XdhC family protein [Gammaproteobacteria bacterium]
MITDDTEVLQVVVDWLQSGYTVELVTLVEAWGSSPRPVGSLAAVRNDGKLVGSVSGGCIEKQIVTRFQKKNRTSVVEHNISHDQAMRFGLPCGGSLKLVMEQLSDSVALRGILEELEKRKLVSRTVDLESGKIVIQPAQRGEKFRFDGKTLIKIFGPKQSLLLIGAGQLSRHVAELASVLDFDVTICEPRESFASVWSVPGIRIDSRYPDEVVRELAIDPTIAVLALTHDPNLDDLALMEALERNLFYVGALGSKRSNESRRKRLGFLGLSEDRIERLHGPIGLDIGSRTSAEIAVSIMAQVIAVRNGKTFSRKGTT